MESLFNHSIFYWHWFMSRWLYCLCKVYHYAYCIVWDLVCLFIFVFVFWCVFVFAFCLNISIIVVLEPSITSLFYVILHSTNVSLLINKPFCSSEGISRLINGIPNQNLLCWYSDMLWPNSTSIHRFAHGLKDNTFMEMLTSTWTLQQWGQGVFVVYWLTTC